MLDVSDAIIGFPVVIVDLTVDGVASVFCLWQNRVMNIQYQFLEGVGEFGAHTDCHLIVTAFSDGGNAEVDGVTPFPSFAVYMFIMTIDLLPVASAEQQDQQCCK